MKASKFNFNDEMELSSYQAKFKKILGRLKSKFSTNLHPYIK